MALSSTALANLEDGVDQVEAKFNTMRRPWCLFLAVSFGAVIVFAGTGPLGAAVQEKTRIVVYHAKIGVGVQPAPAAVHSTPVVRSQPAAVEAGQALALPLPAVSSPPRASLS